MARVAGKVALVTGAASERGIGFAIGSALAREQAAVVLTDILAEPVERRAAELRAAGLKVVALPHDVSSEESWAQVIGQVEKQYGRLDVLVNNAGIAVLVPMPSLTLADFRRMVDINLAGTFLGSKLGMALMCKNDQGGSIINISSVSGMIGVEGTTGYAATKGGIRIMSKAIAIEGAKHRVRCNSIHPGAIWTDIQFAARAKEPELYGKIEASIPLGRIGDPADIGHAAVFLASDESGYMTGSELVVDGGLTAI
jgi:NAD(P)-dependent dehydrogenase (short-subunit alcohol dehydrogenase family)